jgi:hypothetical protein
MHFFVLRVRNSTASSSHIACTAFASCWINDPTRDRAFDKAINIIRDQGWNVEEILEDYPISKEDYADKPEGLEYYEQALLDGEVVVFFVAKE